MEEKKNNEVGSVALREALGRAASERHLAWGANGNPTCESYSFVACPYMPCKRDRELAALSLSSPIGPVRWTQDYIDGRESIMKLLDGGFPRDKVLELEKARERIAELEAQASSEVRERVQAILDKWTTLRQLQDALKEHNWKCTKCYGHQPTAHCVMPFVADYLAALSPSCQGAGGK